MHETKRSPCPHGARREKLEKERRSMLLWHHRFLAWGTFHAPSTHSAERTSFLGRTPQISMKFRPVLAATSGELSLNPLAFLGTVLARAVLAHPTVAHAQMEDLRVRARSSALSRCFTVVVMLVVIQINDRLSAGGTSY